MEIERQFSRGRRALRISPAWLLALLLTSGTAFAASDLAFYERLLTRGVAHFSEGNYPAAISELRVAAFGLEEVLDEFETANVYLALSATRLHNDSDARVAVMRVIAAQRVQSRYAALALPASLREEFDRLAAALLTAEQGTELHRAAAGSTRPVLNAPAPNSTKPAPVPRADPVPKAPAVETAPETSSKPTQPPAATVTIPRASPVPQPSKPAPVQKTEPLPVPVKPKPSPTPPPAPSPSSTQNSPAVASPPRKASERPSAVPVTTSTQPAHTTPAPPRRPAPTLPPAATPPAVPATVKAKEAPLPQPSTSGTASPTVTQAVDVIRAVAEGQRALDDGDLARARERYRSALEATSITHDAALKVGEGLYRTHDFGGAVRAFQRAGNLFRSEAQSQYYLAVSLFETGRYADAKRELTAALPNIEVTPEVARYRTKIEGFAH